MATCRPRKRDHGPACAFKCFMVVRILEVMGLVLARKSSGSVEGVFWAGFWSAAKRGELTSSDSAGSTVKAVAVGDSMVVRVATTEP